MAKKQENNVGLFLDQNQSPSQFLERRLATIYGINSMAIRALDLIREEMCKEKGIEIDVEVDGGINADNIKDALDAGCNVFVAGSAVFKDSITENVKKLAARI